LSREAGAIRVTEEPDRERPGSLFFAAGIIIDSRVGRLLL
jgi:hypothetical protein